MLLSFNLPVEVNNFDLFFFYSISLYPLRVLIYADNQDPMVPPSYQEEYKLQSYLKISTENLLNTLKIVTIFLYWFIYFLQTLCNIQSLYFFLLKCSNFFPMAIAFPMYFIWIFFHYNYNANWFFADRLTLLFVKKHFYSSIQ